MAGSNGGSDGVVVACRSHQASKRVNLYVAGLLKHSSFSYARPDRLA